LLQTNDSRTADKQTPGEHDSLNFCRQDAIGRLPPARRPISSRANGKAKETEHFRLVMKAGAAF